MNTKLTFTQTLKAAAFAALTSAAINAVFFFIFHAAGIFTDDIFVQPDQPLNVIAILISSIMPSFVGALVFFLLEKFTNKGFRIFTIISVILLLASFYNPFGMIPNVTLAYGVALNLLHIVVAFDLLFFINRAIKSNK
ncbi:MAG: hypothetical protein HYZ42_16940 [Bacteroidetes bacterium]|nr:hypothetical protein [Bacteroidota bacterium]